MLRAVVEIRPADSSRIAQIAGVLGRAFVTEPMLTWPLGGRSDDLEERCIRAYALYLGPLLDAGLVWETADGHGALVLVSPEQANVWDDALTHVDDSTTHDMTDDGGLRHARFYEWIARRSRPSRSGISTPWPSTPAGKAAGSVRRSSSSGSNGPARATRPSSSRPARSATCRSTSVSDPRRRGS
jgi:hypothetical protein